MSDDLDELPPNSLGDKNFREDLYKVVATYFSYPVPLQAVPGYEPTDQETKDLVALRLGHVLEVFNLLANPGFSTEVDGRHRKVVEQLIGDLRGLLMRMPKEDGEPERITNPEFAKLIVEYLDDCAKQQANATARLDTVRGWIMTLGGRA